MANPPFLMVLAIEIKYLITTNLIFMKMKRVFLSIMGFALAGQALAKEPADEYKHYDFAIEFTEKRNTLFPYYWC